jgi:hypothetical protein
MELPLSLVSFGHDSSFMLHHFTKARPLHFMVQKWEIEERKQRLLVVMVIFPAFSIIRFAVWVIEPFFVALHFISRFGTVWDE